MNRRKRKYRIYIALGALCLSLFFAGSVIYGTSAAERRTASQEQFQANEKDKISNIVINEICSQKDGSFEDRSDYIELYNPNSTTVYLSNSNLCISDDKTDLWKHRLNRGSIPPGGYLVVFLEGIEGDRTKSDSIMEFKISAGETVYLSHEGRVIDSFTIPEMQFGQVSARMEDGTGDFHITTATPGSSNNNVYYVEPPVFSVASGFYDEDFSLAITCKPGCTVYYTLDSSAPTKNSTRYVTPLLIRDASLNKNVYSEITNIVYASKTYTPPSGLIDKATVVRAVAVDSYGNTSAVASASYFVGFSEKEGFQNVGVLSLIMDPDDLFGDENGIYVTGARYDEAAAKIIEEYNANEESQYDKDGKKISLDSLLSKINYYANFEKRGRDSEREVYMEVLSSSTDNLLFSQACGIRIHGASTRGNAKKALRIYSRTVYSGSGRITGGIFDNGLDIKSLILTPAGALRKFFMSDLVADRAIATQDSKLYQIFLNGEYWGAYNAMERYSAEFIAAHYGVLEENVILVRDGRELVEGTSIESWRALNRYAANNDLSIDENYEAISGMMDIQSYIDWICSIVYSCDMDTVAGKNSFMWRSADATQESAYADGKWRWMSYDNDLSSGYKDNIVNAHTTVDAFSTQGPFLANSIMEETLFKALLDNAKFREQFSISFMDMANYNYDPERVNAMLDAVAEEYGGLGSQISSVRNFFNNRYDYAVGHLASNLSLSGRLVTLTIGASSQNMGNITLNTITPELTENQWDGNYYTDYPVTLTANPKAGYRFVRWEMDRGAKIIGSVTDRTISAWLLGDCVITAVYEEI